MNRSRAERPSAHMIVQPRRSSLRPATDRLPLTGVAGWLMARLLAGRAGAPTRAIEPELAVRQPSVRRATLKSASPSLARVGEEDATAEAAAMAAARAAAARAASRARASRATSFRTESTTLQAQKQERTGLAVSSSSRPAGDTALVVLAEASFVRGTCDWKSKGEKAWPGIPALGRVSDKRGTMAEREMSCLNSKYKAQATEISSQKSLGRRA